ncbi:ABC transporter ATP-binding protein [Alcanivorax sp.]|uniref:ABC transporter ATP-binding protein n=1 Tax=Alcanivorax sp. TaxID=1872427 RepID=UPI002582CDB1|nr:ABC transporter ATP-binding protein [Alcanivorax sp.]
MTTAIEIESLSKKYVIGHQKQERYTALRDVMMHKLRGIGERLRHPLSPNREEVEIEEFWALKDINLEIKQGDRVGIIGRNGAGKSTLLKILSRITEPTKGRVHINGRLASLLEVGTGFHPELTGRENIYLNGAILGMSRAEIKRKFDEIVDFSGVEKFLDTPVKRYSSGMYVRLAFAVAAHLEPEILVVDEVLAVGDAQFQKKCLGKMEAVGKEGRTVLFVSHNMGAISQLCSICAWIDQGQTRMVGSAAEVVNSYLKAGSSGMGGVAEFPDDPKKPAQLKRMWLMNDEREIVDKFSCDEPVHIVFELDVRKKLPGMYGYIGIDKPDGTHVMVSDSFDGTPSNPLDSLAVGRHCFRVSIPPRTLGWGEYMIFFGIACPSANEFYVDLPGNVCSFELEDFVSHRGNERLGYFSTLMPWERLERE